MYAGPQPSSHFGPFEFYYYQNERKPANPTPTPPRRLREHLAQTSMVRTWPLNIHTMIPCSDDFYDNCTKLKFIISKQIDIIRMDGPTDA